MKKAIDMDATDGKISQETLVEFTIATSRGKDDDNKKTCPAHAVAHLRSFYAVFVLSESRCIDLKSLFTKSFLDSSLVEFCPCLTESLSIWKHQLLFPCRVLTIVHSVCVYIKKKN